MPMRTTTIALLGTVLSLGTGCGSTVVADPGSDMDLSGADYRLVAGSPGQVYDGAMKVLLDRGARITGMRKGDSAIQAELDVMGRPAPVLIFMKIGRQGTLALRVYNLPDKEREEWKEKLFREINEASRGVPKDRKNRKERR